MTWTGARPPNLRPGRPYVLRRRVRGVGVWLVLSDRAIVAVACCQPHACELARQWAVWDGAWNGTEVLGT